jgi:hypothetical protein
VTAAELVVLVPVLRRPHRVGPTIGGFTATVPGCRILFIPDPDDLAERQAIEGLGAEQLPVAGNYARKIRAGVEETGEPLIFTGADDLAPHAGWFEAAKGWLGTPTLEGGHVQVVGVNDLIPRPHRPQHATHFLMAREYAEQPTIDGGPGPFHEGYHHWYCDDELIATATKRGVYAYGGDVPVVHLHHMAGRAPDDDTYRQGRENWRIDRRHFLKRSHLWK